MDELLKQLLELELAKVQKAQEPVAPKADEKPAAAAPAFDLAALVEALKPAIAAAVEENVAKAMPVARGEGVGPKGEVEGANKGETPNPLVDLVKKARSTKDLTPAEKKAVWSLTYAALRQGLKEDPRER